MREGSRHLFVPELAELLDWREAPHVRDRNIETLINEKLSGQGRLHRSITPTDSYSFSTVLNPLITTHKTALAAVGDGLNAEHKNTFWLRADPVILHADLTRVHLLSIENLHLHPSEADAFIDSLQALMHTYDIGLTRAVTSSERWYLRGAKALNSAFPEPATALGKPLEHYLQPAAPDGEINWQQLHSECQMLMHTHPVNQERAQSGLPAINAVWFWGGSQLPSTRPQLHTVPDCIVSRTPQLKGLAEWLKIPVIEPDNDYADIPEGSYCLIEFRIDRRQTHVDNLERLTQLINRYPAGMTIQANQQRLLTHVPTNKLAWYRRWRSRSNFQSDLQWLVSTPEAPHE